MKLRAKWRSLRLNAKFTLVIVLLVWVPVIAFALMYFHNTQENLMKDATSAMELELQDTYTQLAAYVDSVNMSTQLFLSDEALTEYLEQVSVNKEMTTQEIRSFYNVTVASLERLIYNNPYLYQIRVYADSDTMQEMMPVLYRMSRMKKLAWAKEDESEWEGWHFDYEDVLFGTGSGESSEKIASYVTKIESYGYGEIGVLEVAISMETLFPDLYGQSEDQWHCFVDGKGTVYFGEDDGIHTEQVGNILPELELNDTGETSLTTIRADGDSLLVGGFYSKGLTGTWISVYDLSAVMEELNVTRNLVFAVIGALLILLTWLINRIVNGLLRGFYNVLGTVREVQKGNLEARVPVESYGQKSDGSSSGSAAESAEETAIPALPMTGVDEPGELALQVNRMLDHINELMEDNIHREVLAKNAEIRSLQNQINAHFIYNVLESIKMMAEIEEKYEISDAVTRLGQLLRYNMYWKSGTVTVREEIEYIRNYIALMNLRFDYEIYLSENLPELVLEQKIPKMTLQPIVENSIIHGIEQMAEDTNIYVKGFIQDGDCIIELTDAGNGMSEERLVWLQKKIAGDVEMEENETGAPGFRSTKSEKSKSVKPNFEESDMEHPESKTSDSGIGLKNVQDRIRLTFGSSYGIQVASKEGCYTKVRIRIPVESA
ncbi:MAG: histidine kinase [Lachnospiraceae bacterium]|nr:histidine kinase [Lachnospiraceae bacterium]